MSTAITLADVAEYLTGADANDGLGGWPGLHAEGNVVHITVKPVTETESDEATDETAAHFEAHVFQVEPPAPVAAEPVELPAELARELADEGIGETCEGWTVVANEHVDSRRWESVHLLVIRNEAGEHFKDTYRRDLTERQDTQPYEYETTARFVPVTRQVKVTQTTAWVTAKSKGGEE